MTTLKPYPAYEDSGQAWLGDIPDHWSLPRLKQVCSGPPEYGANISAQAYSSDGVRFVRTTDIREDGTLRDKGAVYVPQELVQDSLLERGDFLISRSGTIGRGLVIDDTTDLPAAYAGYLVRFRTRAIETARWALLFSRTDQFQGFISTVVISSTIDNVNGQKYANMPIPLPPLDEQRAIADFLDGMDARITRFIAVRRKMIALLEEKKQAVINQAVTRGLDRSVPMKDSGIDWLGEIPAHWDIRRLKSLAYMRAGEGITSSEIEIAGPIPVYGGNGLRGYTESWTHEGQFALIGRQGALCGNVHLVQGKFWASEHAIVARPTQDQDMTWFASLLHTMDLGQYSIAAAQPGIGIEVIKDLSVPFPPKDEQSAISSYIKAEAELTDSLVARHKREIELMQEYRTRLISDVVTGKLDVRGVELPAVEEVIGGEIEAMMEDESDINIEDVVIAP